MSFQRLVLCLSLASLLAACSSSSQIVSPRDSWTRFRGPNGSGVTADNGPLPADIGPGKHVIWKTALPPGHSSPVIAGGRVFLTAIEDEKLVTLCVDQRSGERLWSREAPHAEKEPIHRIGSHAQSTPSANDEVVVSFFGSAGLFCHDHGGELLWSKPMGPFKNGFGAGSSPIVVNGVVLLNQDHDVDSFLMALDAKTGDLRWRRSRDEFPRGFSTPIVWEVDGELQIVVAGTLEMRGYSWNEGKEIWSVRGLSRIVNTTPVVGGDGNLYFASWSPGADSEDRIRADPWPEVLAAQDRNGNGVLEGDEIVEDALKRRLNQIDRDKDDVVTKDEYDYMRRIFETAENVIMAIRPGGEGDITESHVLWKHSRFVPYVPSPLYHDGHVYTVKDEGVFSSRRASDGGRVKSGRLWDTGKYYASPVLGDGKIYVVSERGKLSVLSATPEWDVLATADFEENCYATPAIAGGRIYLRTHGALYCFGPRELP